MPKKGTDGGYRLPTTINPPDRICVTVRVPNDLNHLIAFWGALEELGYWWNWERDDQKRGRDVAAVWREVIAEARANTIYGECEGSNVQVRQRPDEPCKLDVKYGAADWEQFADLRLCPPEVDVLPDGSVNIGGTIITPNAPLGTGNAGFPIQPRPRVIDAPDRTCAAAVNLAEILAQAQRDVCSKITLSPIEQALAAVGVFAAVVAFPPNVLWALPFVAALATLNTFCTIFTPEDKEDLACILKAHATEDNDVVLFDKGAIQNALTLTGRPTLQAIAFMLNYLDESALNYAAAAPAGVMPCPCPQAEMTVWLLSRADLSDQNEAPDIPRSRWWESLTFNQQTGLNRIVLRFDNVAASQGLPSMGVRIRAWNSLTTFDNTTRTPFYVNYLKFTRANSAGQPLNVPAELRIWDTFGGTPQSIVQTGSVTVQNLWASQINTNSGVNGFNNNNEYWILEFSIRTGRDPLSLRATNSLGQTVNWNRY